MDLFDSGFDFTTRVDWTVDGLEVGKKEAEGGVDSWKFRFGLGTSAFISFKLRA